MPPIARYVETQTLSTPQGHSVSIIATQLEESGVRYALLVI